jgi:ABC-type amino acid transport substrate-binding protein
MNPQYAPWRLPLFAALLLLAAGLMGCATPSAKPVDTVTKITQSQTIKLGYREDSAPFSFDSPKTKQAAGYSVELCKRVVTSLQNQLKLPKLDIQWVPVTASNRVDLVVNGSVDLECGSTSRTLGRQQQVDFSVPIFVEGGSFISMMPAPVRRLADLDGKRLGVIPGTTTDASLKGLPARGIKPQIVAVNTHTEGIAALREKRIDAYSTDRLILLGEAIMGQGGSFVISDEYFSVDTYALMLRRDPEFKLQVDRALSGIYRSGEVRNVFRQTFSNKADPTPVLEAMWLLNALPE